MPMSSKVISGTFAILLVSVFCYPVFAVPATPTPIGYTTAPTPEYGTISVSSSPEGVKVHVDGSPGYSGSTPYEFYLTYGQHTITLVLLGYEEWTTTIDVESQDTYNINAMLTPAPEQSLTFLQPFYSTVAPCTFNANYWCLVEEVPKITMNYPYIIQGFVHNPNADTRENVNITINEVPVIAAHFEHSPPYNITFPITAYRGSDSYFQQQYQHDWDWLWVSEDENSYINSNGQKVVDYLGIISGIQTKLYSIYYITQETDIMDVLDDVNSFISFLKDTISVFTAISADYQTSYRYDISSPDVSGTPSETVTIQVPQEKQTNLKLGVVSGIGAGVLIDVGLSSIEEGVGVLPFAAGILCMIKSDNLMRAAADPDLNYTTPISVKPVDIPQLDQQPDSPLKEFALQCMQTASDTKAYADTYAKYQGALESNDSVWAINLQKGCYNYTSQLTDDYQKEYTLAIPAIQYLQEQGYNPTESNVESSMNNLSQNGFSPATVQMLQEAGFSDHEVNSIKNITLNTPYSLVVNYNQSIPYLINLSQQQAQQLNDQFGSTLGILAPPSAQYTATVTSGNNPLTVQFMDASTRNVTQWSWDFGDGQTSSDENPIHTYQSAGDYTVSLTATNDQGNDIRTKYDYITVYPPQPIANFSVNTTSGTEPLIVQFTDTSLNSPLNWNWSFGDGTYSNLQNIIHTYTSAGNYSVVLTISNAAGSNTTTLTDYISVQPASRPYTFETTNNIPQITMDGVLNTSPSAVNWVDGTVHTISVPLNYNVPNQSQYTFISWSGMNSSTSANLSLTADESTSGTYIANYSVQYTTTTTITSAPNSSIIGQPVTFTSVVTGAGPTTPSGKVTFVDGKTILEPGP